MVSKALGNIGTPILAINDFLGDMFRQVPIIGEILAPEDDFVSRDINNLMSNQYNKAEDIINGKRYDTIEI